MQNHSKTLPDNARFGSLKVIHDANAGAVILSGSSPPDDPRLWDIIERWEALTDAVRDQLHGLAVKSGTDRNRDCVSDADYLVRSPINALEDFGNDD